MRIKLKNAIKGTAKVKYTKKSELYASKCDCCGLVFEMDKWCNDANEPGILQGTFDSYDVKGKDGRGIGNTFTAIVCSFWCAHELYFNEKWKEMKEYKPFAKAKCTLVRVSLGLTRLVTYEQELIEQWQKKKMEKPAKEIYNWNIAILHDGPIEVEEIIE